MFREQVGQGTIPGTVLGILAFFFYFFGHLAFALIYSLPSEEYLSD
jgi:hypothetical protein